MKMEKAVSLARRVCGDSKVVELPISSRNPRRIIKRLEFVGGPEKYCLVICRGLSCELCVFPEKPVFTVELIRDSDVLSDLKHRVPIVIGYCCGSVIVKGLWKGSRIIVDNINCSQSFGIEG